MRAQGAKLNQKMEQVIASLLVEPTVQSGAVKVAGIRSNTVALDAVTGGSRMSIGKPKGRLSAMR